MLFNIELVCGYPHNPQVILRCDHSYMRKFVVGDRKESAFCAGSFYATQRPYKCTRMRLGNLASTRNPACSQAIYWASHAIVTAVGHGIGTDRASPTPAFSTKGHLVLIRGSRPRELQQQGGWALPLLNFGVKIGSRRF